MKRVVQIDQFIDEVSSNFGELAIKYKMGLRLILFSTSGTHNLWCVTHSMYCRLSGKRKMNNYIRDRKYISIKAFLTENMVSFKGSLAIEINLKGFCIIQYNQIEVRSILLYQKNFSFQFLESLLLFERFFRNIAP